MVICSQYVTFDILFLDSISYTHTYIYIIYIYIDDVVYIYEDIYICVLS